MSERTMAQRMQDDEDHRLATTEPDSFRDELERLDFECRHYDLRAEPLAPLFAGGSTPRAKQGVPPQAGLAGRTPTTPREAAGPATIFPAADGLAVASNTQRS